MEMMRDNDIHCSTYINDVQALIDEDDANNKLMREHSSQDEFNLTIYHDYPEVAQNNFESYEFSSPDHGSLG